MRRSSWPDRIPDDGAFDLVALDNARSAAAIAAHLAETGHRSCLVAGSMLAISNVRERWEGAAAAAGPMTIAMLESGLDRAVIRRHLRDRLSKAPRPDALFTLDHATALVAYEVLADLSLSIPDDIGFASFDETEWMASRDAADHGRAPAGRGLGARRLDAADAPHRGRERPAHHTAPVMLDRDPRLHAATLRQAAKRGRLRSNQERARKPCFRGLFRMRKTQRSKEETMSTQYRQALEELGAVLDKLDDAAVDRAVETIAAAKHVAVFGGGREEAADPRLRHADVPSRPLRPLWSAT